MRSESAGSSPRRVRSLLRHAAELEQIVVAALYTAFAAKATLTESHLMEEIASTTLLTRTMSEKLEELRAWAVGRTVSAQ